MYEQTCLVLLAPVPALSSSRARPEEKALLQAPSPRSTPPAAQAFSPRWGGVRGGGWEPSASAGPGSLLGLSLQPTLGRQISGPRGPVGGLDVLTQKPKVEAAWCPSREEWMDQLWSTPTTEYYSAS